MLALLAFPFTTKLLNFLESQVTRPQSSILISSLLFATSNRNNSLSPLPPAGVSRDQYLNFFRFFYLRYLLTKDSCRYLLEFTLDTWTSLGILLCCNNSNPASFSSLLVCVGQVSVLCEYRMTTITPNL